MTTDNGLVRSGHKIEKSRKQIRFKNGDNNCSSSYEIVHCVNGVCLRVCVFKCYYHRVYMSSFLYVFQFHFLYYCGKPSS